MAPSAQIAGSNWQRTVARTVLACRPGQVGLPLMSLGTQETCQSCQGYAAGRPVMAGGLLPAVADHHLKEFPEVGPPDRLLRREHSVLRVVPSEDSGLGERESGEGGAPRLEPVSYTHLTLPTKA